VLVLFVFVEMKARLAHILLFNAVDKALKTVQQILEVNRNPQLAEEVDHDYQNKFELADRMTNIAIVAQMNCLERLGLTLEMLQGMDESKSTTLRFQASEKCTFLKEQTVEVPMDVSHEKVEESQSTTSGSSFFGTTKKTTIQRIVKKVEEYHWTVDARWETSIFSGTNVDQKLKLQSRSSSMIVVTQSKHAPIAESREKQAVDLLLTWFLKQIDTAEGTAQFHTTRESAKTPRRNDQVEDAMAFFNNLKEWATSVRAHFTVDLRQDVVEKNNPVIVDPSNKMSMMKSCTSLGIFIPILPLMEDRDSKEEVQTDVASTGTAIHAQSRLVLPPSNEEGVNGPGLSGDDCVKMLNEHVRSMEDKIQSLRRAFPSSRLMKLFSVAEATMVVLCEHIGYLSKQYEEVIQYLEKMLEDQLIKAIGKRVTTEALEQFVRYHNARFLNPPPRPFCHAIGRPNHYPFGVLSIESENGHDGDSKAEPIETLMREIHGFTALKVPLTAATTVELTGKTFLHGWMNHRSQQSSHKEYQLVARARQFSSFLLVIGTMMGPDRLLPKDAIIVQNKDEVLIPLLLNELPSAKEFKDAIQSLSPVQRRFAESFRSMQLESSVFGVAVVQIKPQLELLLGLPEDSLAKEIKLTQDLMKLFIEYQVPSDLLSYDGHSGTTVTAKDKVENVKGHVKAVLEVIDSTKEKQLEEATMKADMAVESTKANYPKRIHNRPPGIKKNMFDDEEEVTRRVGPSANPTFGAFGAAPSPNFPMGFGGGGMEVAMAKMAAPRPDPSPAPAPSVSFTSGDNPAVITSQAPADQNPPFVLSNAQQSTSSATNNATDFTAMPKALDASIEKYDRGSALRSTIIKTSERWSRCRQENLLTKAVMADLGESDVKSEKNKAFDLMDALSRSGSLPILYSDLHVIICLTHCFEKDVMGTVVEDNINPIDRLELSTLLLGSTIHGMAPGELVSTGSERQRLESSFPALLG
jgi:hypothetical protein